MTLINSTRTYTRTSACTCMAHTLTQLGAGVVVIGGE